MAKEKKPAMLFYGREFYGDENVIVMDLAQEGAYQRLLWNCWQEGSIPAELAKLAALCKNTPPKHFEARIWPALKDCFIETSDGRLINRKIEEVRIEAGSYSNKMSRAGRAGAEKRWHRNSQAMAEPSESHPEANGNHDGNSCPPISDLRSPNTPQPPVPQPPPANTALWRAFDRCRHMHPNCTDPDLGAQIFLSMIDNGRVTEADVPEMEPGMLRWLDSQEWAADNQPERFSRTYKRFSEWIALLSWRGNPAPSAEAKAQRKTIKQSSDGVDPYAEWVPRKKREDAA